MAGMGFTKSGFFGGLADGFAQGKKLHQRGEELDIQRKALRVQAKESGWDISDTGELNRDSIGVFKDQVGDWAVNLGLFSGDMDDEQRKQWMTDNPDMLAFILGQQQQNNNNQTNTLPPGIVPPVPNANPYEATTLRS